MRKIILIFEQQPVYLGNAWRVEKLPKNFEIEYWTFLSWREETYRENYDDVKEKVVSIYNYQELKKNVERISKDTSFVIFYPYHNYDNISFLARKLLCQYNIEFCNLTEDAAINNQDSKENFASYLALLLGCKRFVQIAIYACLWIFGYRKQNRLKNCILRFWGPLRYRAKYNFVTSNRAFKFFPNSLEYFSNRNILLHTLDFDEFRLNNQEPLFSYPYVVFIDQGLVNIKWANYSDKCNQIVNADRYIKAMLDLFAQIEKDGYRVVIAAHPKSKYTEGTFGNRPIVYGKTSTLIKYSQFVIYQFSTCLGFVALYKKQFLHVGYTELLENYRINQAYKGICKYFGNTYIDPENSKQVESWQKYLYSATEKYDKFISEFIVSNKSTARECRLIDAVINIITSTKSE